MDLLCPLSTLSLATGQAFTIADPDHASVIRKSNKLQKEAATAPEASGSGRCRYGATNSSGNLPADASEKIQLCKVAAYRVYSPLSLRLRLHNKFPPTLWAALAAAHDRILPCGIAVAGSGQAENLVSCF